MLDTKSDWVAFLKSLANTEVVVKPSSGFYGKGFAMFHCTPDGRFVDPSGGSLSAGEVYDYMSSHPEFGSFVIQDRLKSHPKLVELSASEYLQTYRVWTCIGHDGKCRILHAFLKPIVGRNITDNHFGGKTGNLLAEIDISSGVLAGAVTMTDSGAGMKAVAAHPETGIEFRGYMVPQWAETCALATRAAIALLPLRAIGWDIAATPSGPVLIEAQWNPDPPNFHRVGGAVWKLMAEQLHSAPARAERP